MVVSRSNCKPMSNKINDELIDKCHEASLTEPVTVVLWSSSEDEGNNSSFNTVEKPTVITISDDETNNANEFLSDRPKRNIERTNYNQSKMIKKLYKQDMPHKTSVSNSVRVKRQNRENVKLAKVAEKTLRKLAKQEEPEPKPPSNAIDIENLLCSISSFKKANVITSKTSPMSRRSKVAQEESKDLKFAKISNRAFRYPWEWQSAQKSVNSSQMILGFRTLTDGLCETLMCCRKL